MSTGKGTANADVPAEMQDAPCLTDEEIRELARVAVNVARHFGVPQDMEWSSTATSHFRRTSLGAGEAGQVHPEDEERRDRLPDRADGEIVPTLTTRRRGEDRT